VAALSRLYRGRLQLTGRQATVKRVLEALEGADLAHLAAHGSLRTDNPLFSNLLLADGALTVYDLDRLRRPPHTVVMPACSGAANTVWIGDELLGLSAAFLQMGVSSLIAPVVTIPDDATKDLMVAVHKRLRAGMSPDAALADAIAGAADPSPRGVAVKGAFICLGA
jgi:CHAT domain-containing protein